MLRYFALLPAAGLGSRFGAELPKQYRLLAGKPILWHALHALCESVRIERVWVVLSPADRWYGSIDWDAFRGKMVPLYCGGETRAASVLNGLSAVASDVAQDDWILVHDAARPCLTRALIETLVTEVGDDPAGGLLAAPVSDTLKRSDHEGRIAATHSRENLWRAQTPQMFRYAMLVRALSAAPLAEITDEASAVERLGMRPKLVPGGNFNIKITYPEDLTLAESILQGSARTAV